MKEKAVAVGAEHGISESSIKRAMANQQAARERREAKKAARAASAAERQERDAKELNDTLNELMGLLVPKLSVVEIDRVFELISSGGVFYTYRYEGFTYEGIEYGGEDKDEEEEAGAPEPEIDVEHAGVAVEVIDDDLEIPGCLDRRKARGAA